MPGFAAWAMRDRHGPDAQRVIERAVDLTARLPTRLRGAQQRAIMAFLSEPMLALLQEIAMDVDKIPQSPALRRFLRSLKAQGVVEGKAQGVVEGKAQGVVEGKAEGLQQALIAIFTARSLPLATRDQARIAACTEAATLERWIARAVSATSAREVLHEAPEKKARAPRRSAPKRPVRRHLPES